MTTEKFCKFCGRSAKYKIANGWWVCDAHKSLTARFFLHLKKIILRKRFWDGVTRQY